MKCKCGKQMVEITELSEYNTVFYACGYCGLAYHVDPILEQSGLSGIFDAHFLKGSKYDKNTLYN